RADAGPTAACRARRPPHHGRAPGGCDHRPAGESTASGPLVPVRIGRDYFFGSRSRWITMKDPNDPEGVYTRSDHFSYAAEGIPIAFFTTGLHKDYHRVSDTVDKITFPKMARIAQLVYQSGFAIAN